MIMIKDREISKAVNCPYIDGLEFTQEFFLAYDLNERDFEKYLSSGWRRFGLYFFKPVCTNCQKCLPIRILCKDFTPSKSQRRIIRKNEETVVKLSLPRYDEDIYQLYAKHSKIKFDQESDRNTFKETFFRAAVPSLQSEYYIEGKLVALGFIDVASHCLSSVYFVYDPDYSQYSLGNFSIVKETEIAKTMGLQYYNLGYWVKENQSMSYKGNFFPFQTYNWTEKVWQEGNNKP